METLTEYSWTMYTHTSTEVTNQRVLSLSLFPSLSSPNDYGRNDFDNEGRRRECANRMSTKSERGEHTKGTNNENGRHNGREDQSEDIGDDTLKTSRSLDIFTRNWLAKQWKGGRARQKRNIECNNIGVRRTHSSRTISCTHTHKE